MTYYMLVRIQIRGQRQEFFFSLNIVKLGIFSNILLSSQRIMNLGQIQIKIMI